MADWQFELDIRDIYQGAQDNTLTAPAAAKLMVERIQALVKTIQARRVLYHGIDREIVSQAAIDLRDEVLSEFEEVADDQHAEFDDYDNALEYLYDWADQAIDPGWNGRKMCWVRSF